MIASHLKVNYATSVVHCSGLLFCAPQSCLRSGTHIFPIQIWNLLHNSFLFKSVLLHQIIVGYTNTSFCEWLNFNHFSFTLVNFIIVVFNWYDLTPYYILLNKSNYSRGFHTLSIYLGVLFMSPHKLYVKVLQ